jgi:hypothetical protein
MGLLLFYKHGLATAQAAVRKTHHTLSRLPNNRKRRRGAHRIRKNRDDKHKLEVRQQRHRTCGVETKRRLVHKRAGIPLTSWALRLS